LKPVAAWARPFDDPVLLPGGREFVTLRDAGDYITSLPKAEQNLDAWQAAVEMTDENLPNNQGPRDTEIALMDAIKTVLDIMIMKDIASRADPDAQRHDARSARRQDALR
jgi:hypothetical protein